MPILTADQQPPFAQFIGMNITEVTPERVTHNCWCAKSSAIATACCMAAR